MKNMTETEKTIEPVIRLMNAEDYQPVYALWTATEGMALRSYDDSEEGITRFLQKNPTSNFVALVEGEIVGVLLCGIDGRRAYIYHTVVRQDLRGKGIGKKLLASVYKAIEAAGIKKNGLLVLNDNVVGNAFWQSQGWTKRTDVTYYSKNN